MYIRALRFQSCIVWCAHNPCPITARLLRRCRVSTRTRKIVGVSGSAKHEASWSVFLFLFLFPGHTLIGLYWLRHLDVHIFVPFDVFVWSNDSIDSSAARIHDAFACTEDDLQTLKKERKSSVPAPEVGCGTRSRVPHLKSGPAPEFGSRT